MDRYERIEIMIQSLDLRQFNDFKKYYKNVGEEGFRKEDHIRLRDTLISIEGKFLLSYNDCEFIRDLYDRPGIVIESYTRINNIKQRYDNGAQFPEILIANYTLHEKAQSAPKQMNLFDLKNDSSEYVGKGPTMR